MSNKLLTNDGLLFTLNTAARAVNKVCAEVFEEQGTINKDVQLTVSLKDLIGLLGVCSTALSFITGKSNVNLSDKSAREMLENAVAMVGEAVITQYPAIWSEVCKELEDAQVTKH